MPNIQSTEWCKPGDAAASTATAETPIFRAPALLGLVSVHVTAKSAVAGDNTDNATLTIRQRDGEGGAPSEVCSLTLDVASGGLSAWVPKLLSTSSVLSLPAGTVLTLEVSKGGAGVQLPELLISLEYV